VKLKGWLERLPSGWDSRRLKHAVRLVTERVDVSSMAQDYIGLENIESWTGRLLEVPRSGQASSREVEAQGTSSRFDAGDVLFGKLRPYLAKALLAPRAGVCSTELLVLRPRDELDARFLLYVLLSPPFVELVHSSTIGASMPRANWDFIGTIRIPLPPLSIQRRIAASLDVELAHLDVLVAQKEEMLALLKEKRSALVSRTVTQGLDPNARRKPSGLDWLGGIPANWTVMQLKRAWFSADYGISENIRDTGSVKVLRMNCIVDGRIDLANASEVEEIDPHLLLHKGDLLFNRTNSLDQFAKVGLLDHEPETPTSFASYFVRIRVKETVSKEYLVALLNSRLFLNYARSNAIPAIGQAQLSPSRYGDIRIPLPPREEQDAIASYLALESVRTAELETALYDSIQHLKARRRVLIMASVTGRTEPESLTP